MQGSLQSDNYTMYMNESLWFLNESVLNYTTTSTTPEPVTSTVFPHGQLHDEYVTEIRTRIKKELAEFSKSVASYMEEKGWDGHLSNDDLKWSFPGAVLYAITVITTIGYGHATPKTSHGKIGTIIYALVGIPLVFLYLSNIGDYLADVFRAIYSRTCRNACENYCSISLLASIIQTFLKRHRVRNNETQNEELPQLDATTTTPHGQFRRRKRVLLTTAWNTIENKHAEENPSEMEQADNVNDIMDTTVPKEHNTAQTTKVDRPPISDRIDSLFKKLGFARVARSQKIKEAINVSHYCHMKTN
ncbi:hypothetical protein P879_03734 [Paragonimus westermani]|uniref:Potassium channel domain-containing protein n=1 Tax=Paragonimus westermani TaxID=34504 RepID=A0A8T0D664_9TREM|nr:hypothetical protein P879_03734 [Paragonimus westermani]